MTSRENKQAKRSEKLFDEIVSGRVKVLSQAPRKRPSQSNRKGGGLADAESEEAMAADYLRLLKLLLPGALTKLSALEDPREIKKCEHSLPTLIIYGLIMFLAHIPSRRAANRDIGGNAAHEMIKQVIPELDTIPHADTLARLLKRIDTDEFESCYEKTIIEFLKSKTFLELNQGRHLIAIDGTQKYSRRYMFDERALVYNRGDETRERYCVYVLESVLILESGIVLPLFTEFLENDGSELDENKSKQDCELKAFMRLTDKIKKHIGKGVVTLVVDGLYASGPVMSRCTTFGWDFMITLKRGSLPTVWEDYDGLRKVESDNSLQHKSDDGRDQTFEWSNGLDYIYGRNNKRLSLNIVTCKEEWIEMCSRSGTKPILKTCEFAWLSSFTVTARNVARLCNTIARKRWRIENHFHVEKHQGYGYSHSYSYNWNAMKGFHSLMKFAHFINTLITSSAIICGYVKCHGTRWLIKKVWTLLTNRPISQQASELMQINSGGKRRGCIFRDIKLPAA